MLAIIRSLAEKWPFALAMAARELKGLNKGAVFGIGWLVLRPFIQIAAYVAIVTYVFGARLGPAADPYDYVLYVLPGLFTWQILQRGLEDSTSLIRDRMEIVKQVVYPIETLPATAFLASAIGPGIVFAVFVVLATIAGRLSWTVLLVPLPLLLLLAMLLGLAWIFMVVGVLVKDLREIVSVLMSVLIYFSPVLLAPSMVPPGLWHVILLNPLSHPVLAFRDVLQGGFHPESWVIFVGLAAVSFVAGAWLVNRARITINEYI